MTTPIQYLNLVKETTTATDLSTIALLGAVTGNRTFAQERDAGTTNIAVGIKDSTGAYLSGLYTLTNDTLLTRTAIIASSNGGADVTLAAGTKEVFSEVPGELISKFAAPDSAATTAVSDISAMSIMVEEGGVPKRITIAALLAAIGVAPGDLVAAGALSGTDIVTVVQGGIERRSTLSAVTSYVMSQMGPASAILLSGPASGTISAASGNFTVSANGLITGTVVVTPSDGGAGGTFTPSTVSISSATPTAMFTYTASTSGAKTISATNNGSLANPANLTYTASAGPATAVIMTGPATGSATTASSNFAVSANGAITGTVVVTPSDGGAGGTFTPSTVSISSATPTATFTYTASTSGAKTISATNNGSLTNPANLTYTASAAPASAVTLTGPTGGGNNTASSAFTVGANGPITGTITVTPSDGGGGGTFTPTSVNISSSTPTANFTYTPNSTGTKSISVTNSASLTNPAAISYAVAVAYTITGYNGNAPKTSVDASGATVYGALKYLPYDQLETTNTYYNMSPTPASAVAGWGTSNTTPPATITSAQNTNSGSSINGMVPMGHPGAWQMLANLWVNAGSGTSNWYLWFKPVDGAAYCINPTSPLVVTGA